MQDKQSNRKNLWVVLILGLAIVLSYSNSLKNDFHLDDLHNLVENTAAQSIKIIPRFWIDSSLSSVLEENRVLRPLTYALNSICWTVGHGSPWIFHLFKMIAHLMACFGVFLLWSKLWSRPKWFFEKPPQYEIPGVASITLTPRLAAFFVSLLFAIHPANTEMLNYVSANFSLYCGAFYIWSYLFYLKARESEFSEFRWIGLSLALYAMAFFCKEEGVTLPLLVLVSEIYFNWEEGDSIPLREIFISRVLPYFLTAAVLLLWLKIFFPHTLRTAPSGVSWWQYFITQWRAYVFYYMRLWVWPSKLNADNLEFGFSKSLLDGWVIAAAACNAVLIAAGIALRRYLPSLLFGLLWFYITIAPASSVAVLSEPVNEHRMYLPYVALSAVGFQLIILGLELLLTSKILKSWIFVGGITAVFFALLINTERRNLVWRSEITLWSDILEKNPTSSRAMNNLACAYMKEGSLQVANELLERCENIAPTYIYCKISRAVILTQFGDLGKAEQEYLYAVQLDPDNTYANLFLGRFYQDRIHDENKALPRLAEADHHSGGKLPEAKLRLARSFIALHRNPEAKQSLNALLELDPTNMEGKLLLRQIQN